MLSQIFQPALRPFTNGFLLSMAHFCLPGLSGSRNNLSTMTDPVIIPPTAAHTATVIFLHGLGDTGHGWSSVFKDEIREPFIKYICPHAPVRPVTLNMGMQMPAWYDLYGLTPEAEEDVDGIEESAKLIHSMIDSEVRAGISSDKIVVGGFSMGGALALYAGLTYDKPLAGILGLSSFLIRKDRVPHDCTANKEIPIFMGHGDQDFLVPLTFGRLTEEYLKKFNRNVELKVYRGMSHSSCSEELEDAKQFLLKRLSPK